MSDRIVDAFSFHDKSDCGLIDVPVLVNVLKKLDPEVYRECEKLGIFGMGQGVVDYVLFIAWATGIHSKLDFYYTNEELEAALELEMKAEEQDAMLARARTKFNELDKNGNGTLDWDEVRSLAVFLFEEFGRKFKSKQEKDHAVSQQVKRLKKMMPEDKGWTFEDFEGLYRKMMDDTQKFLVQRNEQYAKGYVKSAASAKFQELDKDGSNSLEGAEVEEFAAWIYEQFHPKGGSMTPEQRKKEAQKLINRLHGRHGHSDGKISFAEFDQYFEEKLSQIEDFKRRSAAKRKK
eukprot:TRINITY_DN110990_c0_g1_i1.p1 TRINITY_DN110990_c0_g1~~TRINITY_DN110990_c0_g1_i1.p1  ORF type:complete len:291 (+),score=89.09 TRINITY_DN110990_c0_g1_i1:40-912(+)